MTALTPPPTTPRPRHGRLEPGTQRLRHDHIQTGTRRLPYYEDLYGIINPDETPDRHADKCESESETDSEDHFALDAGDDGSRDTGKRDGFFKEFTKREWQGQVAAGVSSPSDLDGDRRPLNKGANVYDNVELPYTSTPSIQGRHTFINDSPPTTPAKKLTPRKFGFFAPKLNINNSAGVLSLRSKATKLASGNVDMSSEFTNTAGEDMDSLLTSGGLGDLDDSFTTLEEHPNQATTAFAENSIDEGYQAKGEQQQKSVEAGTIQDADPLAITLDSEREINGDMTEEEALQQMLRQSREPEPQPTARASKPLLLANELKHLRKDSTGEPSHPRERRNSSSRASERLHDTPLDMKPSLGRYRTRTSLKQQQEAGEAEKMAKRPSTRSVIGSEIRGFVKEKKGVAKPVSNVKKDVYGNPIKKREKRVVNSPKEEQGRKASQMDDGLSKLLKSNWEGKKMNVKPGAAFIAIGDEGVDADDTSWSQTSDQDWRWQFFRCTMLSETHYAASLDQRFKGGGAQSHGRVPISD